MQWINKHLGMKYPLDTPLLAQGQKPPKNHVPSQRSALPLPIFNILFDEASKLSVDTPSYLVAAALILTC
eukprot:1752952-Amphidinium_carterae.1